MSTTITKSEQVKLIEELSEYSHDFLKPEAVNHFTKPFGFEGKTYIAKANPQDFKGLSLYDDEGNPIDEARGQDALDVAFQIAKHLNVFDDIEFRYYHGRGSQHRHICSSIISYLES